MNDAEKTLWRVAGKAFGDDPDYRNLRNLDKRIKKTHPQRFSVMLGRMRQRGELIRAILFRIGLIYL